MRLAVTAVGGAIPDVVILIGVVAGPRYLTAGGLAQAEAVTVAADAVHLGQVRSRAIATRCGGVARRRSR